MTMPNERTRAVIQTGEFLLKLSQDSSLPERIRRDAKFLLRHYPDPFQILLAGRIEEASDPEVSPMGPVFSSSTESSYHSPIAYAAGDTFEMTLTAAQQDLRDEVVMVHSYQRPPRDRHG